MNTEAISVFDMFKICVGPSSSHTLGPWRAAERVIASLTFSHHLKDVQAIKVLLYGSLAKTGKGHGTDLAIVLGLSGGDPVTIPVEEINPYFEKVKTQRKISLGKQHFIDFDPSVDIVCQKSEILPFHPNGMNFQITLRNGEHISQTYYSIGGGFVIQEGEVIDEQVNNTIPYQINNAEELLQWCKEHQMHIHEIVHANELVWRDAKSIHAGVLQIWETMRDCIYRGCHTNGELPGGLKVKRRAHTINHSLLGNQHAKGYAS